MVTKGSTTPSASHVLPTVVGLISCLEDNIALNQGRGRGTVLLRLREWNGTAERREGGCVACFLRSTEPPSTMFQASDGVAPMASALMLPGATEEAPEPAWDGEDYFFVDPSSLVAGDLDRADVWKTDAYIRDGRVVLPLDTAATFVFLTGPGSFSISLNGFLIADISEDRQTLVKGMIAGRFPAGELVATLRPLGICE